MPALDEGAYLGAGQHHREWALCLRGDGPFSAEGVTIGQCRNTRERAQRDVEDVLARSDGGDYARDLERTTLIWRTVGPWQDGEAPPPGAGAMPRADWSIAWGTLRGYVQQAEEDGELVDPDDLLAYMAELKAEVLAPVKAWMKAVGGAAEERDEP